MKETLENIKVGNTPIVELKNIEKRFICHGRIFAKLESYNPAGSIKDRVALMMIKDAYEAGKLKKDGVIIEPTSGNTGIGLAYIAKKLGLRCILTMPESMSLKRRDILKSYGAELVLTPASLGMNGAIAKANELNQRIPHSIILGQFDNPSNPKAHRLTTGPEIYSQMEGHIDIFVAGIGTGGTITGVAKYLQNKRKVKIIGVEPFYSPVISGGNPGKHRIQGIGAGFIPKTLDVTVLDEITPVVDAEAANLAYSLRTIENLSVGVSSGAALAAAIKVARKPSSAGKNIVVIFPDGGDRYSLKDYLREEN